MGDRFISSEKLLVIDFTLEDSSRAHNAGDGKVLKHQTRKPNTQETKTQKKDTETVEPATEIVPQTMPPVTLPPQESPTVETQMPVVHSETTGTSAKDEQNISEKGITYVSGIPVVAGDHITAGSNGIPENADAGGRIRYLKANFSYIKELINRHITYPKAARQMGWQGKVTISFIISSAGHAKGIKIAESSGVGALDKNAVDAVKSASPFPKPPVEAQIIIPILYQLN
jgi:protein TonB